MENQVFILLREHYKKHGEVLKPEQLRGLKLNLSYVLTGIMQFDQWLDEKRVSA